MMKKLDFAERLALATRAFRAVMTDNAVVINARIFGSLQGAGRGMVAANYECVPHPMAKEA